ncbi:MAG: serine/threonine protein kinase [Kofleriaceae bacterium]
MKLCPKCQKQFSDDANFCPVDAARLVPLEAGAGQADSLAARFDVADRLGGNRTGAVHRGRDKQTGAAVAIKLVAPTVLALPGVAQRLERELKQLERVPSAGVTRVVASGKIGEQHWVALEMLEGAQTLADAISARGPIPPAEAAHLVEVIGEALIEAAQVGVVHRDLAPKNVLITGQDIKLINFSLPVPINDRIPGVPEFVAPEQVEGKPVDQRSNLYSLGALYYYVLTGQTVVPSSGNVEEVHRAHINAVIQPPSSLAPVPAAVDATIMRALDRSPTKRFLTVRQFVDEVGRIARGEADPQSTQALGKAGRGKVELVQTLLGMRSGVAAQMATAPRVAPQGSPPPAMIVPDSAPVAAHVPAAAAAQMPATKTVFGMPGPVVLPQQMSAVQQPAGAPAANERSPWAPPAAGAPPMAGAPGQPMPGQPMPGQPMHGPAMAAGPMPGQPMPGQPMPGQPMPGAPHGVAQPQPAMHAPASPVIAPPQVSNAPAPAGKKKPDDQASKGKFRETMWFKKGDMDAAAAVAAAEQAKTGEEAASDKADTLPIDDRYKDDGSISRGDKEKYSLRTGATQMMMAVRTDQSTAMSKVSEDALIGEMKGGRNWVVLMILVALAAVGGIVYYFVVR